KADERQLRMISGGVYQGLDYLGAKTNSDYDLDFLRLRVSGVQRDRFFDNWQGVASGALYWSDDSLPDSERAVFGGRYFGRGYPVDQASGDKGWGLAYEVNYSVMGEGGLLNVVQPYAVLDTAQAWFNKLDVRSAHLASLALGVRMGDLRDYNLSLEIAKPLADAAFDSVDRQPRFTVSVSLKL
ncbi:MAG: ShlB/FhaC/HecB family hemolysin secretion/activation protein, partial [Pseudomonas sp.]|nr:ShlB/FhaC/HecB family hemolysin secretion/activation protein [Pseudomonas sp.]